MADLGNTCPANEPARSPHHPAIEGLRAVAALSVVMAHALVPGFSGGFVGVDVFFVISGFLVCRMLYIELDREGRINLTNFWARRMRRLLPNAALTLLVVLLLGLFFVPGFMRIGVAKDVAMSALHMSNYHFAGAAVDYFGQDELQSPVRHFWSLAVEVQFYIVWPAALVLLCMALGHDALPASRLLLAIVSAASLAGMLLAITQSQPVAFFHSWARAWQLGMGGLLAIAFNAGVGLARRTGVPRFHSSLDVLGWIGLGAVCASVYALDEGTLYPGLAALVPTLGAALVVAAITLPQHTSWGVGALLSTAPFRWLGVRSYSWYLWHWPALILAELTFPDISGVRIMCAAAALVVASAVFTFIEDPIRRGAILPMSAGKSVLAGLALMIFVVAAAVGFAKAPHPGGAETAARNANMADAQRDHARIYRDNCHLAVEVSKQPDCEYGELGSRRRVVLFGDSHAAQWFPALDAAATAEGWSLRSWTKSSCPASDIRIWYPPRRSIFHECIAWREAVMAELTGPGRPDLVVISSLMDYTGWLEKAGAPGQLLRKSEADPVVRLGFERTVRRLLDAGIELIVVRDTPRMIKSLAQCYVGGGGSGCDVVRERALPKPWIDVEVVRSFPPGTGIRLLDLTDAICEPNLCRIVRDGNVIWQDSHHIRAKHARLQSEPFRRLLREISESIPK